MPYLWRFLAQTQPDLVSRLDLDSLGATEQGYSTRNFQNKLASGPPNHQFLRHHRQRCIFEYEDYRNEEFKDWPDSLLAIGTFGNRSSNLKESTQPEHNISHLKNIEDDDEQSSSSPDLAEFTPEEVGKLQKELTKLLSRKTQAVVKSELVEIQNADDDAILPLDRFLNCPSSLEVDRRINSNRFSSANCSDNFDYNEEEMDRTIRVIIGRCKDKSISFLVKKMFVCTSGGFGPAHSLRDTFPESRMEKLLKAILSKKIHPQNAPRTSTKRYLEDKHPQKVEKEEKKREKTCDDGSKWVKTDSDCLSIAKEVWEALKAALSSTLNTQILNLHVQLQNMKQDDLSITQCLYKAKLICDMLAVVARPLTLSNQNIYIFRISK
ncbi:hypothetical protein BC332_32166 [Capsicum chinense]|nr:hypothetical protein BC332_32166 [Capsicum chinense]